MTTDARLQTWDVLKEFGFQPDNSVFADGLVFDFGNMKLCAGAVINRWFVDVVMFTGFILTRQRLVEVEFEMPLDVDSREQCASWLAWHLESADRTIPFQRRVEWMDLGRASKNLLPWEVDLIAYTGRPQCHVEREWARILLKRLRNALLSVNEESVVWFSFDGEVLKVRCAKELVAVAASGTPWTARYGVSVGDLAVLPSRLPHPTVELSVFDGFLVVCNRRYTLVNADVIPHE